MLLRNALRYIYVISPFFSAVGSSNIYNSPTACGSILQQFVIIILALQIQTCFRIGEFVV